MSLFMTLLLCLIKITGSSIDVIDELVCLKRLIFAYNSKKFKNI